MIHLEAFDPESGRVVKTALDAMMSMPHHHVDDHRSADQPNDRTPCGTAPGVGRCASDERTHAQRVADAIIDLASSGHAAGTLPENGGDRPHVLVTVDWETLVRRVEDGNASGALLGAFGGFEVSPETARRLACDADVIPAVLGGDGAVLDLGRHQRTWTTAQRRAARLRDGGCVFPRCQAGLDRCQLHHLWHRADGGLSDLDNSAHLCTFHHWLVHHRKWEVRRDPTTGQICVRRT